MYEQQIRLVAQHRKHRRLPLGPFLQTLQRSLSFSQNCRLLAGRQLAPLRSAKPHHLMQHGITFQG